MTLNTETGAKAVRQKAQLLALLHPDPADARRACALEQSAFLPGTKAWDFYDHVRRALADSNGGTNGTR